MLVVVDSADDASMAIEGGADRIVLRVSAPGGAVDRSLLESVGRCAEGRSAVSLWLTDAPRGGDLVGVLQAAGADEVRLSVGSQGCTHKIAAPDELRRIGVVTAAVPFDSTFYERASADGLSGLVIGDAVRPRRLLHTMTIGHLQRVSNDAKARGFSVGFSGTLEAPDIPRLLAIAPDEFVFDSTVRQDGTVSGALNPERIRFVRELVPRPGTDEQAPRERTSTGVGNHDRVFVRDWTISAAIGAYEAERAAQRVRFDVEVDVLRSPVKVTDLRHVVSYDLITDAISRFTVDHVELVETLAEDIAGAILAHPRVVRVDISIEKLDLGPGAVGCRLTRTRGTV